MNFRNIFQNSVRDLASLALLAGNNVEEIDVCGERIADSFMSGGALFAFGNGGSSASASHFCAEFTGKLKLDRDPLPAFWIGGDTSATSAIGNDYGFDEIFSRQVLALVRPADVVIGISTSGASPNVIAGLEAAKKRGAYTVMLSGASPKDCADLNIRVRSEDTPRIQEIHDFLLHMIAQNVESRLNSDLSVGRFRDPFPFLLSEDDLPRFADWAEGSKTLLVSTNGVYDLLHGGHRKSLEESHKLGDQLVVLINSDASVQKIKKDGRPIRSESERVQDLQSLPFVSHVYIFDEDSPLESLLKLRPSLHTKGSEYEAMDIPELALESRLGTKIVFIPRIDSRSTSDQISKIREGLMDS